MKNVLEYLEESAGKYPNKPAVCAGKKELSYEKLLSMAKRIGLELIEKTGGVMRRPVAVLLEKTPESVAAFMGVLYSGNFYVVLDDKMPGARARAILDTLKPVALLTDEKHMADAESLRAELGQEELLAVCMESIREIENSGETELLRVRQEMIDTDPVYALFTSGSTGVPKGAVVTHANVISYIEWFSSAFNIGEDTIFGSQTPFYFSMSVSDLYSTLKCGATLYIIPKEYFTFPMKLMEYMNTYRVNTIYWVPSALGIVASYKLLDYAELPELKKVLFAGEVMPTRQLNYWRRKLPDATYANLFGPTETTDICTYYVVDRTFADDEPLPMGRACNNCQVFVMDDNGKEVTADSIEENGYSREGELYVRGSFVAPGYYDNDEKTREAFVQNPLNTHYPETVYKTGDLVKYNRYGELVYICRKDYQIKHMGYRIELGEIEAAAGAIDGIRSFACVYDDAADKLVFFYEGRKKDEAELLRVFKRKLPYYMEPNRFVRVAGMPLNANGKIDRKKLKKDYL